MSELACPTVEELRQWAADARHRSTAGISGNPFTIPVRLSPEMVDAIADALEGARTELALQKKRRDAGFPYGICCTKCSREITGEPQFSGIIWPSGDPMEPEVHGVVCAECWTTHGTKVEESE